MSLDVENRPRGSHALGELETTESFVSGPMFPVFRRHGLVSIAEKVLAGDELPAGDLLQLSNPAFVPCLLKLSELAVKGANGMSPRASIARVVALAPLARWMESEELERAEALLCERITEVLSLAQDEQVYVALDRWSGTFSLTDVAALLGRVQSAPEFNNRVRLLGPSTAEALSIADAYPNESVESILDCLSRCGILTLEGGGHVAVHQSAIQRGFRVSFGQELQRVDGSVDWQGFVDTLTGVCSGMELTWWFPWTTMAPGSELVQAIALGRLALPAPVRIRAPLSIFGPNLGHASLAFGADELGFVALDSASAEALRIPEFAEVPYLGESSQPRRTSVVKRSL